jgi:glycosyltransferase involved in cell wall biosynthesis
MRNAPKVSIIIPTHNRPDFLLRALDSVYTQTYTDFEVIVVDDGNAPRAYDVLSEYRNRKNFMYLETEKDRGGSKARNIAIQCANGEYIAFLDDDDAWLPEKLEIQMSRFEKMPKEVGFSFTSATMCGDTGETHSVVPDGVHDFSLRALTDFNGFLTVTQIVRTAVLREVGGFDEQLQSHQEPELVIRLTQAGYLGLGINMPLTRVNALSAREGVGTNYRKRIQGRLVILEKHAGLYQKYPHKLARSYFEVALWYRALGDWKQTQKYMFHAWRKNPLRFRYFLHFVYATGRYVSHRNLCDKK